MEFTRNSIQRSSFIRPILYGSDQEAALTCSESGVLAPLVGVIGLLQAMEAMKLLTGFGETLRGKLLMLGLRNLDIRRLARNARTDCPACSHLHSAGVEGV